MRLRDHDGNDTLRAYLPIVPMNSSLPSSVLHAVYAHLEADNPIEAERLARHALTQMPDDMDMLMLLGMALLRQGRRDESIAIYGRLTDLAPGSAEHWCNLATALREAGRLNEAEAAYVCAQRLAPGDAQIHFNMGLLNMERALYVAARSHFLDAVDADPNFPDARIYGAMMCYECGDNPGAERLVAPWRQWSELTDELRVELAWLLTQLGDTEIGERLLEQALDSATERPRVLARLVLLRERVNRLDEARELAKDLPPPESVGNDPAGIEIINAHAILAARGKDPARARELLLQLLKLIDSERKRSNLYFVLGHICDKQGDYVAAMDAFKKAHASQMETASQVMPELLDPSVEPLRISTFLISPEQHRRWKTLQGPSAEQSPVFVVGFPRSGTTMLEQMLDAHPSMRSMDERAFLQGVIERMNRLGLTYPDQAGELEQGQIETLREAYWKLTSNVVQLAPGQRLVDKNPLNMLRLPMINRLFPNAKVILCLRHPCDVLTSCYMQSFRSPAFGVLCSTLERLARGYVNAMRSWIHHAELLKPDLLIWRYESALEDFPGHVQRAGEFLELEDAAPLAQFHEHARNKGFISTPSYHQVVQPPNKKALGRWRHYAEHFGPALEILQPIMQHWNYEV